jgi:multimeric flavodoxin WrbA
MYVKKTKQCVQKDDRSKHNYFYTFNGSMKLLIDRTFAIEKTDVIEKAYHMTKEIKINE